MGEKKETNVSLRKRLEEKNAKELNIQFFSDDKEEDKKKITRAQKLLLILLGAVVIGILCTFIGPRLEERKDIEMPSQAVEASTTVKEDKGAYDIQIEKKLEDILKQIEGVGEVQVMVTLAETKEIVLAEEVSEVSEQTEEKDSSSGTRTINKESTQNKVVMTEGNKPYIIKEAMPKINGVLVVAQGGDDSNIKNTIIQSVSSLLDIPVHKVSVFKMSKN